MKKFRQTLNLVFQGDGASVGDTQEHLHISMFNDVSCVGNCRQLFPTTNKYTINKSVVNN